MAIYIHNIGADPETARAVERKLRRIIPDLAATPDIKQVLATSTRESINDPVCVLIVTSTCDESCFVRLAEMASIHRGRIFFVLISNELSIRDYKALVRHGNVDWVSVDADPQEILDILARQRGRRGGERAGDANKVKPVALSFVPSAGGVGNTTLALETGVKLKTDKTTRDRNICIVDLDFQKSHICDYLDLEPRLKIQELQDNPERLDDQLFDIFISRHMSGLHVFAAPRGSFGVCALNVSALDAFFNLAARRYDLILIDLPATWFPWTDQVVAASDGVFVTGLNSIPGLRQIVETLTAVRGSRVPALHGLSDSNGNSEKIQDPATGQIAVAVNRCQRRLTGGILRRHHVETVLGNEKVFYVGEESTALESINTGTPIGITKTGGAFVKDIAAIAAFCGGLKSSRIASA
jgi:pilus assembly protein CpaE